MRITTFYRVYGISYKLKLLCTVWTRDILRSSLQRSHTGRSEQKITLLFKRIITKIKNSHPNTFENPKLLNIIEIPLFGDRVRAFPLNLQVMSESICDIARGIFCYTHTHMLINPNFGICFWMVHEHEPTTHKCNIHLRSACALIVSSVKLNNAVSSIEKSAREGVEITYTHR